MLRITRRVDEVEPTPEVLRLRAFQDDDRECEKLMSEHGLDKYFSTKTMVTLRRMTPTGVGFSYGCREDKTFYMQFLAGKRCSSFVVTEGFDEPMILMQARDALGELVDHTHG